MSNSLRGNGGPRVPKTPPGALTRHHPLRGSKRRFLNPVGVICLRLKPRVESSEPGVSRPVVSSEPGVSVRNGTWVNNLTLIHFGKLHKISHRLNGTLPGFHHDRRRAEGDQGGRVPRGHAARRRRGTDARPGTRSSSRPGAGLGSGIADDAVRRGRRRRSSPTPPTIWARADLIVKVKEPLPAEWPLMRPGQTVFTYFHFAADEALTRAVHGSRASRPSPTRRSATRRATLPLLTPMSEVAGRMSIQEGAKYLERPQEGRGILLGGRAGRAPRPRWSILGGGVVGANAAKVAAGLGANVRILDVNLDRLRYLDDVMPPNVTTLYQRPAQHPRLARAGRPGHRRGADPRGEGPAPGPPRGPEADEAAGGDHRRGHRPGRLRRDEPADDAPRSRPTSSTASSTTA